MQIPTQKHVWAALGVRRASGLCAWPYSAVILLLLVACRPEPDAVERDPNVVILYTDDQRFDTIHALGNEEIRTPNMDRLVREGTTFTRAQTMGGLHGALCAPSRSMLMTGRPLFSLYETGDVIPDSHITMPEYLADHGYQTFATGKWHNDRESFARSFSSGGSIFFGGMHWPGAGGHEAPQVFDFDSTGAYPNEARRQVPMYSSMLYADEAIAFIESVGDAPFFAHVSFTSPHDPRTPPPPFDTWYPPDSVTVPPNFLPEHPFDNGELRVRDEMLREHPRTEQIVREELAGYYGMISEVDAQIGRILDALETAGLREHTLVVFAGDNGLAVGSHGLLGKQNLYEHSMRVPLIMTGPGIEAGQRLAPLAYIFDIFPTIMDYMELQVPATVEGKSLMPAIRGASLGEREAAFYAYRYEQRAVRTADDWKLIRYNVEGQVRDQLFNLAEDPYETQNLAADTTYAGKLAELKELLVSQSIAYSDPLDLTEWVH